MAPNNNNDNVNENHVINDTDSNGSEDDNLADDLAQAVEILRGRDAPRLAYVAQFLGALARTARDPALEAAARRLAGGPSQAAQVVGLIEDRLAEMRALA